jgi:hypothetical protein
MRWGRSLDPGEGSAGDGPSPALIAAVWLLLLAGFATVALQPLTNIDIAWHLLAAREWRRGAELYREIRDPNLPAAWLLYRAQWWLGDLTGLPAHRVFFGLVAAWGCLCGWLTQRLLPVATAADRWLRLATLAGIGGFFALASLHQAGQRDYIIVVGLLPYAAWVHRLAGGAATDGRWLGALATLIALLALQLKPYLVLAVVVLELWLAWRRRSLRSWRRADLLLPALLLALLVGAQLLALPAYREFLADWGGYYARQGRAALSDRILVTLALYAAALLWSLLDRRRDGWGQTLLALAGGALLACAAQDKWWDYHAYPFELLVELAWCVLLVEALCDRATPAIRPPPAVWRGALRLGLGLAVLAWFAWIALLAARQQKLLTWDRPPQAEILALTAALDGEAAGRPVAFFGGLDALIAVYHSQARWGLPMPTLWVEGPLVDHRRRGEPIPAWLADAAQRHFAEVLERLRRGRPVLLGFFHGAAGAPNDFLALYRDQLAIALLLERDYEPWGDIAGYALYHRRAP